MGTARREGERWGGWGVGDDLGGARLILFRHKIVITASFKGQCTSHLKMQGTLVCTAEYQGVGTSLAFTLTLSECPHHALGKGEGGEGVQMTGA